MTTQRMNIFEKGHTAMTALYTFGSYLKRSGRLETELLELMYFRVSQINGCAYCLDMHAKDLRAKGESEQRLYMISAWREAPVYTDRERAALAWGEALTLVTDGHVPDEVYEYVAAEFSEEELADLTIAVLAINSYNRVNLAFRTPAGGYVVGQHG